MKTRLIATLCAITVIVALAGGAIYAWSAYNNADASAVPIQPIHVAGQDVLPTGGDVFVPVLGGLLEKPLDLNLNGDEWHVIPKGAIFDMPDTTTRLGELGSFPYSLSSVLDLPDTMDYAVSVYDITRESGTQKTLVFTSEIPGAVSGYEGELITIEKPGDYWLCIDGALGKIAGNAYGTFYYRMYFTVTRIQTE